MQFWRHNWTTGSKYGVQTWALSIYDDTLDRKNEKLAKTVNIKLNPTIFFGERKNLIKHKTELWNFKLNWSLIPSFPEQSSSKSALCVNTQTLPVSICFNFMDSLEVQKLSLNLFNLSFFHFAQRFLLYQQSYHQWIRLNWYQSKRNLNLSVFSLPIEFYLNLCAATF